MSVDPFDSIEKLEQLATRGKLLLGKCFINEDEFFVTTARLKRALPQHFMTLAAASQTGNSAHILRLIDRLEYLIEASPKLMPVGVAIVDSQQYGSLLAQLRDALNVDLEKAAEFAATQPADPGHVISDARAEAEQIIQEAHAEAERILAEARQQAAQSVSGPSLTLPDSLSDTPDRS